MNAVGTAKGRGLVVCVATVVVGLAGAWPLHAEGRRIMVGESIHVRAGETVPEAACIACGIYIDGVVTGDVFVVLGTLENRGTVGGDATVIGGALESSGSVLDKALVVGGRMRLLSAVAGDVIAILGTIDGTSTEASVGGDAVLVIGRQSGLASNNVKGSITDSAGGRFGTFVLPVLLAGFTITMLTVFGTCLILNTLAYLVLGAERAQTIANTVRGNLPACFLVGMAACLALTAAALMVAILLPVAIPILAVFVLVSVIGYCGVTFFIGGNLFPKRTRFVAMLLASVLVISIQLLPVLGWFVLFLIWNIAVGAAILSGFGTSTDWLARRTVPPKRPARAAV